MHGKFIALALAGIVVWSAPAAVEGISLEVDPQAVMEILPLAVEAVAIQQRAAEREERHAADYLAVFYIQVCMMLNFPVQKHCHFQTLLLYFYFSAFLLLSLDIFLLYPVSHLKHVLHLQLFLFDPNQLDSSFLNLCYPKVR